MKGSELYGHDVILKFITKADGREAPEKSSRTEFGPYEEICSNQTFLCVEKSETQYKFHDGTHLELVAVFDKGADVGHTPDEFKRLHPMPAR
jgi:hypothetical protein